MKTIDKVHEIANAVHHAGGRALMVGGCVRDHLLGETIKDYDLEIYGLSAAQLLAALEPVCETDAVGMSFGVLKAMPIMMPFFGEIVSHPGMWWLSVWWVLPCRE